MTFGRAFLVAIFALLLTACAAGGVPSPSPMVLATIAPSATTPSAGGSQAATDTPQSPGPH